MDRRVGDRPGGTLFLSLLLQKLRTETEYELITHGARLRDVPTGGTDWRDVYVICRHPVKNGPLYEGLAQLAGKTMDGWGVNEYLLALIADAARWLVWSKTEDGAKNRNHPKPLPRPGQTPDETATGSQDPDDGPRIFRGAPLSVEEAAVL